MTRGSFSWRGFLLFSMTVCMHAWAIDALPFHDRAEEIRYQQLARQLRCLVCQNQDLADSDADLARDLRLQVLQLMQSGKSDSEIKTYLTSRYSDYVLYDPPFKPATWLLWLAPFALFGIGAFAVRAIVRRRERNPVSETDMHVLNSGPTATPNDEEDW